MTLLGQPKNGCMDVLQRLQSEVDDGNVNVLVVATSGHLARYWNGAESINLNQALSEPKIRLFLSPVLTKPPGATFGMLGSILSERAAWINGISGAVFFFV